MRCGGLERLPQRVHRRREMRELLEMLLAQRGELRGAAVGEPEPQRVAGSPPTPALANRGITPRLDRFEHPAR